MNNVAQHMSSQPSAPASSIAPQDSFFSYAAKMSNHTSPVVDSVFDGYTGDANQWEAEPTSGYGGYAYEQQQHYYGQACGQAEQHYGYEAQAYQQQKGQAQQQNGQLVSSGSELVRQEKDLFGEDEDDEASGWDFM